MPAARQGDRSTCDGKISAGSPNVLIGGGTVQTDDIEPEVPDWLHRAVLGLGVASAMALSAGPVLISLGLAGGYGSDKFGHWLGGKAFGEGSDGQKITAFTCALLGGLVSAKGGHWFDTRYQIKFEGLGSNLGNIKAKPYPAHLYRRGRFRSGVKEKVWEIAQRDSPDGIVRDPLTQKPMTQLEEWDMGHKPGYEHWKHVQSTETRRLTRKEFLDEYNNPTHYRPELPFSNRSHAAEITSDDYYGP